MTKVLTIHHASLCTVWQASEKGVGCCSPANLWRTLFSIQLSGICWPTFEWHQMTCLSWGRKQAEILCLQRYNWIDLHDLAYSRKNPSRDANAMQVFFFLYFHQDLPYSTDLFFFSVCVFSLTDRWSYNTKYSVESFVVFGAVFIAIFFFLSSLDNWLGQHLLAWIWGSLAVDNSDLLLYVRF